MKRIYMAVLVMIAIIVVPGYAIEEFGDRKPYPVVTQNHRDCSKFDIIHEADRDTLKTIMGQYEHTIEWMRGVNENRAEQLNISKKEAHDRFLDEKNQRDKELLKKLGY